MILSIQDDITIREIQEKFCLYYPFLKIEFYRHPHGRLEYSSEKEQYSCKKSLGQIRQRHNNGMLEIHGWYKTGDVEQVFNEDFGLYVQVFRREGDVWIQTAGTDDLSLEEQDEIGRTITRDQLHGSGGWIEREKPL